MVNSNFSSSRFLFAALVLAIASLALARTDPPNAVPPAAAPAAQEAEPPAKRPSARQRAKSIGEISGVIETARGPIAFKLEPNKCPLLCANFCNLARRGFFDDRPFHAFTVVLRHFGTEEVWYTLPREFDSSVFFDAGGRLAMAITEEGSNSRSNGTRFFITTKNQERWNLVLPIFGSVTSGLDTVIALQSGDRIRRVTVSGDVDALLKEFAPEIAHWNAVIDQETSKTKR